MAKTLSYYWQRRMAEQSKGNALLHVQSNTQYFYIVDSDV
jgi:hypothetical protein